MPGDELEEAAMRAAEIAGKLPDKYQEKAFELVLGVLLAGAGPVQPSKPDAGGSSTGDSAFKVPLEVRAILDQYEVHEESLRGLYAMEGTEIVPKYFPKKGMKARAQIQLALMLALESALKGGKFEFNVEDVRKRCQTYNVYDGANFNQTFKKAKNSKLFTGVEKNPEHVGLTADGKAELAAAVAELAK